MENLALMTGTIQCFSKTMIIKANRWFHSTSLLYDNEHRCSNGYAEAVSARQNNCIARIDDRRYGGYDTL